MTQRIKIDDTYTYEFDAGEVSILRHGQMMFAEATPAKAWIAAANEIEELRKQVRVLYAERALHRD